MHERRRHPRRVPLSDQRLLTLHGSRGHICGRAEDESISGLAVRVPDQGDWEVGQTVLVHRMYERELRMGTIRYLNLDSNGQARMGIEFMLDSSSPRS